jgi:hypothetical protein
LEAEALRLAEELSNSKTRKPRLSFVESAQLTSDASEARRRADSKFERYVELEEQVRVHEESLEPTEK